MASTACIPPAPAPGDAVGLRERARGALLGLAVGDALGGMFEAQSASAIRTRFPAADRLIAYPQEEIWYTDDTQMTIALAEALYANGEIVEADLCRAFAGNYVPARGYGFGARRVLEAMEEGRDDEVGGRLFGGQGSFGNGAAMRVAPVGALYHETDRAARLRRVADAQAAITHTHVLGRQGATLQAAAVAAAFRRDPADGELDREAFLEEVIDAVGPLEEWYREGLNDVRTLIRDWQPRWEAAEVLQCGIEAHLSVPAALYAFLARPDRFEAAVSYAVRLGNDTDTVGAMCGAIAGAYHGASAIPSYWTAAMENGETGRDYITALANRLFETWQRLPPSL